MALEKLLWAAQCTGRGDPAFDREHEDYGRALLAYAKTRTPADLAKIPCKPGKTPRLYGVRVLTVEARAFVTDTQGAATRDLNAVRVGVAAIKTGSGPEERPDIESKSEIASLATREWCTRLGALGGGSLIDELAELVLRRADFGDYDEAEGDSPLVHYALPRGSTLAR